MNLQKNKNIFIAFAIFIITFFILIISKLNSGADEIKGESLDKLLSKIHVTESSLQKAPIDINDSDLYNELPEINKYPLVVQGTGEIDIEIFTSGEKGAQSGTDSWLTTCADSFNKENYTTSDGKTISISLRSVSSGLAADYIISGKYLPDLYTPSNILFGEYASANGGNLEIYKDRLVGNTAGLLFKKDSDYKKIEDILNDVMNGKINIGYTNPQTSATGLNLLVNFLKIYGNDDVNSAEAENAFSKFNNNIPFVAYTTQQMVSSASNGTLDGMVTEYQAYINDDNLTRNYKFIPFGLRHDNPLYIVNKNSKSKSELEAIDIITEYLLSNKCQSLANKCGFNENNDYKDSYSTDGIEITRSLKVYKKTKDSGRDIIAVFIADCSGSMDGAPIMELKNSLSNGMKYINENNQIGLISYSTNVNIEVPISAFDMTQKSYFQGAINRMQAGGATHSYEAVCVALKMIEEAKVNNPDAKCMIFLLSDGYANGKFEIKTIKKAVLDSEVPIYTIGYTNEADTKSLKELSDINEATIINADSDDIVYKIKSLFNAQL